MNDTLRELIADFIAGQNANTDSPQAAALAAKIKEEIKQFIENGGENENAFSVDAQYEDGIFSAQCDFTKNTNMIVMYEPETDNETVQSLFDLRNDEELSRIAGLMLSEGWVKGYKG